MRTCARCPTYGATDGGPSVLLSNADGASPYSGVVRVQSRATCTGVFLATTADDDPRGHDASAWVATNAHCVDFPGTNEVLHELPGRGTVTFDYFIDTQARQLRVPIRRIAYATMKGHDVAFVELSARVGELRDAGFEPWRPVLTLPDADEPVVVVGAPLQSDARLAFLRLAACRLEGRAPLVLEYIWHWWDFERTRCGDIQPGSSGSPVISRRTGRIVGLLNTTNAQVAWYTACQIDSPCEPTGVNAEQPEDTSYVTPLIGVDRCFVGGDFDMDAPGCPIDPGIGIRHSVGNLGHENPAARQRAADSASPNVERPRVEGGLLPLQDRQAAPGRLPRPARLRRCADRCRGSGDQRCAADERRVLHVVRHRWRESTMGARMAIRRLSDGVTDLHRHDAADGARAAPHRDLGQRVRRPVRDRRQRGGACTRSSTGLRARRRAPTPTATATSSSSS